MTAPRGSARYFNEILRSAVERTKELVDETVKVMAADGYAPLTLPLTLKYLLTLEPTEAVTLLRDELARTTRRDETTGAPIVDRETIRLITEYMGGFNGDVAT